MNTKKGSYYPTTLYVGNLYCDVTKEMLFEKFSQTGPLLSIHCRTYLTSRRSLYYAYVTFQRHGDAQRALDTMNFDIMNGRPMCIMWHHWETSFPESGVGDIIVIKKLDKSIDNKDMYDIFSTFGTILNCNVATDEYGNSKGYGFIRYAKEESANKAVETANGKLLRGKIVFVTRFITHMEYEKRKELAEKAKRCTNVYIKNLPEYIHENKLKNIFEAYGVITSYQVVCDEGGKSRGFGFVTFKDPVAAELAVINMNGKKMGSKTLYVGIAKKRAERHIELKRKLTQLKLERKTRYQGGNLYVKNLDSTIDDAKLRKEFHRYGTITSAKVMMSEDGRSKGFGFVCFSSPEEAIKAVFKINGSNKVSSQPFHVTLAQRKEDRNAQLTTKYIQRMMGKSNIRMQQIGQVYNPGTGHFKPTLPQPQRLCTPSQKAQICPSPRLATPQRRSRAQGPDAGFTAIQSPFLRGTRATAPSVVSATAQPGMQALCSRIPGKLYQRLQFFMLNLGPWFWSVTGVLLFMDNAEMAQIRPSPRLASNRWVSHRWASPRWASPRWASPRWASPRLTSHGWASHGWASPRWASPRWASHGWASPRWASPRWASPRWATLRWASPRWASPGFVSPWWASPGWASLGWASPWWASPGWALHGWPSPGWALHGCASPGWVLHRWASPELASHGLAAPQFRPVAQGPIAGFNTIQPPLRSVVLGTAPAAVSVTGQQNMVAPLSSSALAAAYPHDQEQMLRERLFRLIHHKYPTVSRKVTGMLLELENSEILSLLEDSELLSSRVEEAITVLEMYQSKLSALQTQN